MLLCTTSWYSSAPGIIHIKYFQECSTNTDRKLLHPQEVAPPPHTGSCSTHMHRKLVCPQDIATVETDTRGQWSSYLLTWCEVLSFINQDAVVACDLRVLELVQLEIACKIYVKYL